MRTAILLVASLAVGGCATTFQESHYFSSDGSGGAPADRNYYRLLVKGGTAISSSRYVSGYFDSAAVDVYFNEIKQPPKAQLVTSTSTGTTTAGETGAGAASAAAGAPKAGDAVSAKPLSRSLVGKDLVLILSTNSDEVSNQIGALAANQQFTAALAGLAARGDFAAAARAGADLSLDQSAAAQHAALADTTNGKLPDKPTAEQNEAAALVVLNRIAFELDHAGPFTKLDEADKWFQANRSRVTSGGKQ